MDRRQFLRGAGGFTLALPLLPSLLPRAAQAATTPARRFVAIATEHGGVWTSNMFPAAASLTERMTYKGHEIRRGALSLTTSGASAGLSPTLSAGAGRFTAGLAGKMNVIQGLDHPFYLGHHSGGHLGNIARNDGNGACGQVVQAFPMPTIDQVMAWSPSFYPDLAAVKERSLVFGDRLSYYWSSAETQSGSITAIPRRTSSRQAFNAIFNPPTMGGGTRTPVVDRVLESYQRLRTSSRRLSAADRARLDEHVERIHELDRKLNVVSSCQGVTPPSQDSLPITRQSGYAFRPELMGQVWGLINDVIVAAFVCGTCRIATLRVQDTFSDFQGDWHQDVAHQANQPDGRRQATLLAAHQRTFEAVFLDLIAKLDLVMETDGSTLLDNCLVQWSQESGCVTHDPAAMPVVTAGSACGWFRTGQYLDYRNLNERWSDWTNPSAPADLRQYSGLVYNQFLGGVLDAMGVPRGEWTRYGENGGYGKLYIGDICRDHYAAPITQDMSGPLPWLKV